jgi:hypothetical protein
LACGQPSASLKRRLKSHALRDSRMSAIAMIVAFIVVMFAFNLAEFGRLD